MKTYHVLAVDIEASGSSMKKNGIVSLGASVQDSHSNEVDNFQNNIELAEGQDWEERCLTEFWNKNPEAKKFVETNALPPEQAMKNFIAFEEAAEKKYDNLRIVSDNPSFDIAWLNSYIANYTDRKPLNYTTDGDYRIIWDTHSMQKSLLAVTKHDVVSEWGLPEKLGFSSKWTHDHNPLNDARTIADYYNQTNHELEQLAGVTTEHSIDQ